MTTPQLPPPSNQAMLPVLATVMYVAAVVALWGILSLLLNRDVIDLPLAGPLLGPTMAAVAAVITWLLSWRAKRPVIGAFVALVSTWLGMLIVAAIGYNPTCPTDEPCYIGAADGVGPSLLNFSPLDTAVHFALSPFVAGAAVLSAFTVLAVAALRRAPRDSR